MVVFSVGLEVRGEFVDARREQCNLHFGAAGVGGAAGMGLDDVCDGSGGEGHAISCGMGGNRRTGRTQGVALAWRFPVVYLRNTSETDRCRAFPNCRKAAKNLKV
jgi:hypothetical protein